jgi:diacylglycerol O-acyltransferase
LLDDDPLAPTPSIEAWTPRPEPSDARLALDAVARLVTRPARQLGLWSREGAPSANVWARLADVGKGVRSLSGRLLPQAQTSIEGPIGPHRRWAVSSASLSDIKVIREAFGGSVNDVVLAAVTGAFRALLLARGEPVDGTVVRTLVPVSRRAPGDRTWNNQVSLILADLPVDVADPVDRLAAMHAQMSELKQSHQVTAGEAMVAGAQLVPPAVLALTTRAAMAMMRRSPQRFLNTVTTNVPGPQRPLYAVGREMLEYLPFVPLSEGVRIGVAILSYNGRLAFGVTGDYDTVPDVNEMARQIEAEVNVLRARAGRRRTTATGRRLEEVS